MLSASDLTGFAACQHLAQLERLAAQGLLVRPQRDDPELDILTRRGEEHELAHLARLRGEGLSVVSIRTGERSTRADLEAAQAETVAAMRAGAEVIYQATFFDGRWRGHADFLLRVRTPSALGDYSYEVADTKLARRAKVAALLQMSNYSEHLTGLQKLCPERMHVILGNQETESFFVTDYAAYYRAMKSAYEAAVYGDPQATYPDPVDHCGICRWQDMCLERRREDDHLSLVAGMRRDNTRRIAAAGITTLAGLASTNGALSIDGISEHVMRRLQQQARLQLRQRETGNVSYEVLRPQSGLGLNKLPAPSPGDLFFDMEGDPFVGENGLEYLFGVVELSQGEPRFRAWWAHDPGEEKAAFEGFVDFATQRLSEYPAMHIYHYAAYEPVRLKSLMGRHATRETEVDRLLRGEVLVDLYQVVRNSVRVSQESYSIKKLEPLYNGAREAAIVDAGSSIVAYEEYLQTGAEDLLEGIERYNEEDCVSTYHLRDWLEARRDEAERIFGDRLERPAPSSPEPAEARVEEDRISGDLARALNADMPPDPQQRTAEQQANWVLSHLLGWHWREEKTQWWDYYHRCELSDDDLVEDSASLGNLTPLGEVGQVRRSTVYRYSFDPAQVHRIKAGDSPHDPRTRQSVGTVVDIDHGAGIIDIRRTVPLDSEPRSIIPGGPPRTEVQRAALRRVAQSVLDAGIRGTGPYAAVRHLLLRELPEVAGVPRGAALIMDGEEAVVAARRLALGLKASHLPVQGPPGSGKTWTGARMIVDLVRAGRRVGITAVSHKVICNLLDELCRAADAEGVALRAMQKAEGDQRCESSAVRTTNNNADVDAALVAGEVDVVAGTSWLFSRHELDQQLDVLFVDEAGQMSLADVAAVATAAHSLVLLGDPQQLAHPSQAIHPDGTGMSALKHLIGDNPTIAPESGVFLDRTFRMHPDLCAFISEIAYEKRLLAHDSCAQQALEAGAPIGGTGVRLVPVEHSGNRTVSHEEIAVVRDLVRGLIGLRWTDARGASRSLRAEDIIVVSPYNAQVDRLREALPAGCAVGTVDKFQGQEAAVAIYSLASSSPDDMPRQFEFLYSLNRLNVAMSRARALAVLVCSPAVFRVRARRPQQAQLANAFCRLVEVSRAD